MGKRRWGGWITRVLRVLGDGDRSMGHLVSGDGQLVFYLLSFVCSLAEFSIPDPLCDLLLLVLDLVLVVSNYLIP